MNLLRLSIQQTYGKLGIETENARQTIESPRGELNIETKPEVVHSNIQSGTLTIDSSEAWHAMAKGGHFKLMNMIYSQMDSIALQAIAKKVEDGNRMAMITNKSDAFADLAQDSMQRILPTQFVGEASFLNVKVNYEAHPYQAETQPAELHINYTQQKVQAEYQAGKVNLSVQQEYKIDIRVSDYNWNWQ